MLWVAAKSKFLCLGHIVEGWVVNRDKNEKVIRAQFLVSLKQGSSSVCVCVSTSRVVGS